MYIVGVWVEWFISVFGSFVNATLKGTKVTCHKYYGYDKLYYHNLILKDQR
jgi:hypothetical protein